MVISKKVTKRAAVKANSNRINRAVRRPIKAADEEIIEEKDEFIEDEGAVDVAPEASDLLFEAEDVAELIAEVTGKDVTVEADENKVTFEVGEDSFEVEAEEETEILESTKKPLRNKKSVKASRRIAPRKAARRR